MQDGTLSCFNAVAFLNQNFILNFTNNIII